MIVETLKWIAIAVVVGLALVWLVTKTLSGGKDDDE